MVTTLRVKELGVQCDSLLIVSQVNGEYTAKDDQMVAYLKVVATWKAKVSHCNFKQIPRSENIHADSLATFASAVDFQFRREIPVEYIPMPSIRKLDEEVLHLDSSLG